jgi:hypothetical protein
MKALMKCVLFVLVLVLAGFIYMSLYPGRADLASIFVVVVAGNIERSLSIG